MNGSNLLKLLVASALAVVAFVSGFFIGMSREERIWQQAAVRNKVARWQHNPSDETWTFLWLTPTGEQPGGKVE